MTAKAAKKTLWHVAGLLGTAIVTGLFGGLFVGLAAGDTATAATYIARGYLSQAVLLPLGLGIAVVAFGNQDRELYARWGWALAVTLVPAALGAFLARIAFVGPATTVAAMIRPRLDAVALALAIPPQLPWGSVLAVAACNLVGGILVAIWARRQGSVHLGRRQP